MSKLPSGLIKQKVEQIVTSPPLQGGNAKELDTNKYEEIPNRNELKHANKGSSVFTCVADQILKKDVLSESQDPEFLKTPFSSEADGQQKIATTKLLQVTDAPPTKFPGQLSTSFGQVSSKSSIIDGHGDLAKISSKSEAQKISGFGFSSSFMRNTQPDTPTKSNFKDLHGNTEVVEEPLGKFGLGLQGSSFQSWKSIPTQSWSSGKSEGSDSRSQLFTASHNQGNRSENSGVSFTAANDSDYLGGKSIQGKDIEGASPSVKFSDQATQSCAQRAVTGAGKIESIPSIRSSSLSSQLSISFNKSSDQNFYASKDDKTSLPKSGTLKSEPNLSKQFSNVSFATH